MKTKFFASLLPFMIWSGIASAQNTKLTCIYRASSAEAGLSDVILTFASDRFGRPAGGSMEIIGEEGARTLPIPASAIRNLSVQEQSQGAELVAVVHVQSRGFDMMLNYVGNDFYYDAIGHLGFRYPHIGDVVQAYGEMLEGGLIEHRTDPFVQPMAQMTGSVRWYGELRRINSSKFVCTAVM